MQKLFVLFGIIDSHNFAIKFLLHLRFGTWLLQEFHGFAQSVYFSDAVVVIATIVIMSQSILILGRLHQK